MRSFFRSLICGVFCFLFFFFFKQKTAYEMRISDWSSDVCSSDLLLDNVAKYAGSGTLVTIEGRRTLDQLTLSVLDEGPGLPPGGERALFERFARVEGSDRVGGTGLGLAIVKGFAAAMGLSVTASNRAAARKSGV